MASCNDVRNTTAFYGICSPIFHANRTMQSHCTESFRQLDKRRPRFCCMEQCHRIAKQYTFHDPEPNSSLWPVQIDVFGEHISYEIHCPHKVQATWTDDNVYGRRMEILPVFPQSTLSASNVPN